MSRQSDDDGKESDFSESHEEFIHDGYEEEVSSEEQEVTIDGEEDCINDQEEMPFPEHSTCDAVSEFLGHNGTHPNIYIDWPEFGLN